MRRLHTGAASRYKEDNKRELAVTGVSNGRGDLTIQGIIWNQSAVVLVSAVPGREGLKILRRSIGIVMDFQVSFGEKHDRSRLREVLDWSFNI